MSADTILTLFKMAGSKAPTPPYHFSLVTSAKVGISPQNFLTFSSNPFVTLVYNFKAIPRTGCFWSNPYKIGVVITSLIEMLQLPNFGHITTSTI